MADDTTKNYGAYEPGTKAYHAYWMVPHMALLTNNSGASVSTDDVLVLDTSADESFTTTTNAADPLAMFLVPYKISGDNTQATKTIANGEKGWVYSPGPVVDVDVDGAVSVGEWLVTSTTAKKLTGSGKIVGTDGLPAGAVAICIKAAAAAGTTKAIWMGWTWPGLFGKGMSSDAPSDDDIIRYDAATGLYESESLVSGLTLIASTEVTGSAVSAITFNNIPGTYRSLFVTGIIRPATDLVYLAMRFNNDSGTNYVYATTSHATGAERNAGSVGATEFRISNETDTMGNDASFAYPVELWVHAYAETTLYTPYTGLTAGETGGGAYDITKTGGWYESTSAVTRLDFFMSSGNIDVGSFLTLYGTGTS